MNTLRSRIVWAALIAGWMGSVPLSAGWRGESAFQIGTARQQRLNNGQRRPDIAKNGQDILFLTEDQEREVLGYLEETYPERIERLHALKQRNPVLYRQFLSRGYREMLYMQKLKEEDPQHFEIVAEEKRLEQKSRELADQYRKSRNREEQERLRNALKDLLDQAFDLRQKNRQYEIDRLEQKLDDLKEQNQKRREAKDEIVEKRLLEMLGEEGLVW